MGAGSGQEGLDSCRVFSPYCKFCREKKKIERNKKQYVLVAAPALPSPRCVNPVTAAAGESP